MEAALKQNKATLRTQVLARQQALTPAEVLAASRAIAARLAQMTEYQAARGFCAYVSTGNEVETHTVIRELLRQGRRISVPRFDQGRYVTVEIADFDNDLRPGHWGILEPVTRRLAGDVDVWLVPGVVFDRQGHRLGHGKGYFDRLLAGRAGTKIGLGFDFQLVDAVPVAAHDVRLDYIITENRTVKGI